MRDLDVNIIRDQLALLILIEDKLGIEEEDWKEAQEEASRRTKFGKQMDPTQAAIIRDQLAILLLMEEYADLTEAEWYRAQGIASHHVDQHAAEIRDEDG